MVEQKKIVADELVYGFQKILAEIAIETPFYQGANPIVLRPFHNPQARYQTAQVLAGFAREKLNPAPTTGEQAKVLAESNKSLEP